MSALATPAPAAGGATTSGASAAAAYARPYVRLEERLPGVADPRIRALRRAAHERFLAAGFPASADPRWKGTDPSGLARGGFEPVLPQEAGRVAPADVEAWTWPDAAATRVTLVDGHYAERPGSGALQRGVRVQSLAEALERDPGALADALGRLAITSPLAALNTALFQDGAFIEIDPGVVLAQPLHVLHLASGRRLAAHARTLIAVGENAQGSIVESYAGAPGSAYWTNAVTEVTLGASAVVDHAKLQRESENAFHTSSMHVALARGATFTSHSISLGGGLTRNELVGRFDGEGGECTLSGLFAVTGNQRIGTHTILDHAKPRCSSREVYKGVLDGTSRGAFDGMIVVRKDAQKTDAKQTNKNLLLSRGALVDSNPQLEIHADDVKCTHGSTTGQLDADALFYLRSRGLAERDARAMLTLAFAKDIVDRLKEPALAARVNELLSARLSTRGPA